MLLARLSFLCDIKTMKTTPRTIKLYVRLSGSCPFEVWFNSLSEKKAKALVLQRIDRVQLGNFGNCRSVGHGVYELKIYYGPGIRVYFGLEGESIVLLLCAGDKSSQSRDIPLAHELWKEYKSNEN